MWVRLDEGMPLERQHRGLSDAANWLLVCMVAYSNRELADGAIERTELGMVRPGADPMQQAAALDELERAGAIEATANGWQVCWLLHLQPTADEARRHLEQARERQRRHRERKLAERDTTRRVTRDTTRRSRAPVPDPIRSDPRGEEPNRSEGAEQRASAPAEPSPAAQIHDLESQYDADLVRQAREACALSRKNGKLADSVWLRTLRQLSAFDRASSVYAMQQFVERHADGDKDEAYLVAIARKHKSGNGRQQQRALAGIAPARVNADYRGDDSDSDPVFRQQAGQA